MGTENDGILFEVKDPNGRTVFLSKTRYYEHITSSDAGHQAHTEFTIPEMEEAIKDPEAIYESNLPDAEVYFCRSSSLYPKMYLSVAVATYEDGNVGDIMTAHLTKHISGNINEGGLLYVRSKPRV